MGETKLGNKILRTLLAAVEECRDPKLIARINEEIEHILDVHLRALGEKRRKLSHCERKKRGEKMKVHRDEIKEVR